MKQNLKCISLIRIQEEKGEKMDLKAKIDENNENLKKLSGNIIKMSALKNIGIDKLYEKITEMFNLNEINLDNENVIANLEII